MPESLNPKFLAPAYRIPDDEFAEDEDISFMRAQAVFHDSRDCLLCEWLGLR